MKNLLQLYFNEVTFGKIENYGECYFDKTAKSTRITIQNTRERAPTRFLFAAGRTSAATKFGINQRNFSPGARQRLRIRRKSLLSRN